MQIRFASEPSFLYSDWTPIVTANVKGYPSLVGWRDFDRSVTNALQCAWQGEASVRTALQQAIPAAEAALREAQGQ